MESLAFNYDRHEEITRRIQMRHLYYHPTVANAFMFKNFRLVLLRFTRYAYKFLHLEANELLLY